MGKSEQTGFDCLLDARVKISIATSIECLLLVTGLNRAGKSKRILLYFFS